MSEKLLAFHCDPSIKEKYLKRVREHREADEIAQGQYWRNGKGCAVGCTLHGDDHSAYERELGIPIALAYLEDRLFELMPLRRSKLWPEEFLQAVPVGADLSGVVARFLVRLQEHNLAQVNRLNIDDHTKDKVVGVIRRSLDLLQSWPLDYPAEAKVRADATAAWAVVRASWAAEAESAAAATVTRWARDSLAVRVAMVAEATAMAAWAEASAAWAAAWVADSSGMRAARAAESTESMATVAAMTRALKSERAAAAAVLAELQADWLLDELRAAPVERDRNQ